MRSENPTRAARVRQLIEQLDTPGRPGGNLFIIYLKNADAARVAQTLRALLTGRRCGGRRRPVRRRLHRRARSRWPARAAVAAAPAARARRRPRCRSRRLPARNTFNASGVDVQADTANNALIIMAPEPLYNNLRAIIEKLDVRRAQVLRRGADRRGLRRQGRGARHPVAGAGRARQLDGTQGVRRHQLRRARQPATNIIDIAVNPLSAAPGPQPRRHPRHGQPCPGLGQITNLAFLARALETQVAANILSTPTLLTLDNEEARIIVGQNVPFVTGQYATTGGTTTVHAVPDDRAPRRRPRAARAARRSPKAARCAC